LSGTYHFVGKPATTATADSSSELRFDEKAMAMTVRTVIEPHTVVVKHEVSSGMLTVDVLGKGSDARFALMSARLPLIATFSCIQGAWIMDSSSIGSGGGRSSETRQRTSLQSTSQGLIAVGTKTITTGTFSRKSVTHEWQVQFDRIVESTTADEASRKPPPPK
jgi:hypothetical protein